MNRLVAAVMGVALLSTATMAGAADPPAVTIHAGKADSLNHALAVQFAEAVAQGNTGFTVVVEESQGSVQNIKDALNRGRTYVFTAPPSLIAQARRGDKPFQRNRRYRTIRALFPIPAQTVQWIVRADSDARDLADLAGKSLVPGAKGSVSEIQTASALHALGLDKRVQLIDIDARGAEAALAGKQVAGIAFAGAVPLPAVSEVAKATPVRFLSLTPDELAKVLAADDSMLAQVIPRGTYPGQDRDVTTIALPAGAYATTAMSEKTAYAITKAFWSQKWALAQRNPPWSGVTPTSLPALGVKLHPGAMRYYREAGIKVPKALR
ncbi:MAG TPA: TAXI family TRAP transporter solute-binding subunit [Stellaceae bacterium]|nr:TAXI family TRAP transporter solute-binding subunit [Stellaceae bacterium]